MDHERRNLIIPITKEGDNYRAILSDDSLDRDGEFMDPKLIQKWASGEKSLPILADHENSMKTFLGAWKDRKLVESDDGHLGLSMTPVFFSADANPLAPQIKKQIDEAIAMGLQPGVSIGFIPSKGIGTEKGFMHTDAEILEGSFVPVQSNRNAYAYLAKRFKIGETVKKGLEVIGASGIMSEENSKANPPANSDPMAAVMARMDATDANVAKLNDRMTACEQMLSGYQENAAKAAEQAKADAEKRAANEETLRKEIEASRKELDAIKEAVKSPKAKIPAAMMGGVSKESQAEVKNEIFDAARTVAKKKGLIE